MCKFQVFLAHTFYGYGTFKAVLSRLAITTLHGNDANFHKMVLALNLQALMCIIFEIDDLSG